MEAPKKLLALITGLCLLAHGGIADAQETDGSPVAGSPVAGSPVAGSPVAGSPVAPTARPSEVRYVQTPRAQVFAGPSEDYYPTSLLSTGDAVEVFQRTGEGWLAIRPPKGSFSWLPAAQGLLLPGGRIVEVTDKSSVSWIGTSLGTAKQYRWQVRLSRGEQLAVLGEQTMSAGDSEQKTLWYKIAPPNGEFRWIREQDTTLDAPPTDAAFVSADGQSTDGDANDNAANEGAEQGGGKLASGKRVLQSVLTASFEDAAQDDTAGSAPKTASNRNHSQGQRMAPQSSSAAARGHDPWNTWHAIEYSNGSFSFPGVARLFGIEPTPVANSSQNYDPFDLAAGIPRPQPQLPADSAAGADPSAVSQEAEEPTASETELAHHKFRGWRDPRKLREMREGGSRELTGSGGPGHAGDVVNAGGSLGLSTPANDLSATVGTGVLPAGATAAVHASGAAHVGNPSDDPNWYGIRQAPQTANTTPPTVAQADLGEVQLRLSEIVSGPQHTWNLAPLANRTRYLIEHGATAVERGEARLLMDRIEAFADLARRSAELGAVGPVPSAGPMATTSTPVPGQAAGGGGGAIIDAAARWASPLGVVGQATEAASGNALRFDATGWVVPVHTSGRDMPTHALTNDAGKIIVYLSPAPGVNLARYQGQAVGVYGLRGYLPQLKTNHIQVQRSVRLQ